MAVGSNLLCSASTSNNFPMSHHTSDTINVETSQSPNPAWAVRLRPCLKVFSGGSDSYMTHLWPSLDLDLCWSQQCLLKNTLAIMWLLYFHVSAPYFLLCNFLPLWTCSISLWCCNKNTFILFSPVYLALPLQQHYRLQKEVYSHTIK